MFQDAIQRTILDRLVSQADQRHVSVLIGPRQAGKTVLLRMLQQALAGKTTYLDVENPMDATVLRDGLRSLLAEIGDERQVLMLDEFHRIPDALALLKQLHDHHPRIKVYASGSSSIEIHDHLKQSAAGRVRRTRIFPLSFPEWCGARGVEEDLARWDVTRPLPPRVLLELGALFEQFVVWGGMPEAALAGEEDERREILGEIVALYLDKDVRSLLRAEEVMHFNEFLRLLAVRVGQVMNRNRFGRQLSIPDRKVVRQLTVMEHTFVYRPIRTDYANPTKRLVKAPKIYWYDNGIRNALIRDFRPRSLRPDAGALLENHVLCELEKAAGTDVDILYHRTHDGQEIDFVLERDRRKLLVEVKSAVPRPRIPPAFRDMLQRDDTQAGVVLGDDSHEPLVVHGKPVFFLALVLAHRLPDLLRER